MVDVGQTDTHVSAVVEGISGKVAVMRGWRDDEIGGLGKVGDGGSDLGRRGFGRTAEIIRVELDKVRKIVGKLGELCSN